MRWCPNSQVRHSPSGKPVGNQTNHTSVNDTIAIANTISITIILITTTNISLSFHDSHWLNHKKLYIITTWCISFTIC